MELGSPMACVDFAGIESTRVSGIICAFITAAESCPVAPSVRKRRRFRQKAKYQIGPSGCSTPLYIPTAALSVSYSHTGSSVWVIGSIAQFTHWVLPPTHEAALAILAD